MEPFSLRPRRPTPSLSLPLSLCLVLPPARPVPVAVYKSGRRLYPPTTLHRMEQRGGGTRRRAQGGQRSTREGVRGHTIRVPTASGVTRCNLRRIVAEIRDWNRGRVMNRTRFSRPFSISFRGFRIFFTNRPLSPLLLDLTVKLKDRADIANLIFQLFCVFGSFFLLLASC